MVPERKLDGKFTDRKIHGVSNVSSAAQRQKQNNGCDVHAGFEGDYISFGYGIQLSLAWSCVEDR